jgi:hypothetical protein
VAFVTAARRFSVTAPGTASNAFPFSVLGNAAMDIVKDHDKTWVLLNCLMEWMRP